MVKEKKISDTNILKLYIEFNMHDRYIYNEYDHIRAREIINNKIRLKMQILNKYVLIKKS